MWSDLPVVYNCKDDGEVIYIRLLPIAESGQSYRNASLAFGPPNKHCGEFDK